MGELFDVAAERAVLAGVWAHGGDAWADVADLAGADTFWLDSNQVIFRCLERVFADDHHARVDFPSVLAAARGLKLDQVFADPDELTHLRAVKNMADAGVVRLENVRKLAGRIRKLEIARQLTAQLEAARHNLSLLTGDEPVEQILGAAEGPVFDFTTRLAGRDERPTRLMGDGAADYLRHLMDNPRDTVGISTGLPRYDGAIGGGLRPGSVDLVSARAKTGKSMLTDHVALHVAGKLGIPVLNLDTEMSWEEHLHRVAANLAGLPIRDIERGVCGDQPENRAKVEEAAARLREMPYHYRCITGEPFEETLAHMRRWVLRVVGLGPGGKANPCVVIYDYLKIMSADSLTRGDLKEWQMLGFLATGIKNFAGRFGVPVLAFSQQNKEGDVAASDRLKWFCTSISHYRWKKEPEMAEQFGRKVKYTHELYTELARHGPGMEDDEYINVLADYAVARVEEGPSSSELRRADAPGSTVTGRIVVDDSGDQDEVPFAA